MIDEPAGGDNVVTHHVVDADSRPGRARGGMDDRIDAFRELGAGREIGGDYVEIAKPLSVPGEAPVPRAGQCVDPVPPLEHALLAPAVSSPSDPRARLQRIAPRCWPPLQAGSRVPWRGRMKSGKA